jgi:hypothetical protein
VPVVVQVKKKSYTKEESEKIISNTFRDLGIEEEMVSIAKCESGLNNNAINPKDSNGYASIGLFQVSLLHNKTTEYLTDPYNNSLKARELYLENDSFSPWYNCATRLNLL